MSEPRAILDFPDNARQQFSTLLHVVRADDVAAVRPALEAVERACAAGAWAVGFVAAEAAPAFDDALRTHPRCDPLPLAWFGIFAPPEPAPPAHAAHALPKWMVATSRADHAAAVARIREHIAAGDVYQVNHTLRFTASGAINARALYDDLVARRQGRYHALIETDAWSIVSASPELFIDIRDGVIRTRPMKGTHRRGRWLQEDVAAAAALAASAKDRAENLMIVDLLRNDIGRVAKFGTVEVPEMFCIETYPTVHQMTSTVTAQLRTDAGLCDVFAAMFPCGSVTGAPKVAAMQVIHALEDAPRGAYCGAIGVVRPDGSCTFNVGIRTITIDHVRSTAVYGSGGGITWDSAAAAEYDEVAAKAALLSQNLPAITLLETMRLDDGVFARLDLHIERVRDSAAYWGMPADAAARFEEAVRDCAVQHAYGSWRVRVTIGSELHITREPLASPEAADAAPVTASLARTHVRSDDPLLFHKTTARATYEHHRNAQPHVFDVLLFNERDEVTEFTIGNVVAEIDGRMVTPPRTCGLLAGCMREELLRSRTVTEAVITVNDVRRATRLWLANSVRGLVPVQLL